MFIYLFLKGIIMPPKYFIEDVTKADPTTGKSPYIATGDTIPSFISYLEGVCERMFGMTREQFIIDRSDYVGYTDNTDEVFYDLIRRHVKTGVWKMDRYVEADVLKQEKYSSKRAEYGD
jgi:hypothetical protein